MLNPSHAPNVDPLSSRTFAVTTFDAPQLVVLLVEDNPGDARLIRIMLAEPGYAPVRLVHVDRLAAALERVRHSDITVVLLDLGLPDSQGLETFVELRDAVPHLPIVVLSGDTDTGLALRAVREGAQDYLLKNRVDSEVLVRALRYAVEHKRINEYQRYLSETSRVLSASLDYETTVDRIVRLPVPLLAEACVLELHAENCSAPRLVVYTHEDTDETQLLEAIHALSPEDTGSGPHAGGPSALQHLGFTAHVSVPLTAHGRQLGRLWLLRAAERPGFTAEECGGLDELALRSALALDNARLHRELEIAVRLRDDVLASTSHDLRSPLSGIKMQGALLRRLLHASQNAACTELHERVGQGLDDIDAAISSSLSILQELLDAVSLQAGRKLQLDRRRTNLTELVRRVAAEHQRRTEFHQLRIQDTEQSLVADWDGARLSRVIDNLLSNAIKYSPRQDTITLTLARETNATGDWAVLRVQDHGVGIPRGEMRQVFDWFYRGSNIPREIRGVGIGLAGVRDIVEQHGGEISVESAEGIGSTFTVHLPLQSVERDRHANPPAWVAPLLPRRVCRPGKPAAILMSRQVTGGLPHESLRWSAHAPWILT